MTFKSFAEMDPSHQFAYKMGQNDVISRMITMVMEDEGEAPVHIFHEWTTSQMNSIGLPTEFQCAGCQVRWGWTGTEWGYLEE